MTEAERIAIRQQITAIDYQITELYKMLQTARQTAVPAPVTDDESDVTLRTLRMRYVLLRLNNIRGSRIKERIRVMAHECVIGGFVQRTGNDTFSVLAISPKKVQVQEFTDLVVQNFGLKNVTIVSREGSVEPRNEKLASYHARGFKKVSTRSALTTERAVTAFRQKRRRTW